MDKDELRLRRAALGMSQAQLAERLGVPRMAVYRWERGGEGMRRSVMLDLALQTLERNQALGVTPRELARGGDDDDR